MRENTKRLLKVFRLRKCFTWHPVDRRFIADSIRWHRNSGFREWVRDVELASLNFRQDIVDKLEG